MTPENVIELMSDYEIAVRLEAATREHPDTFKHREHRKALTEVRARVVQALLRSELA